MPKEKTLVGLAVQQAEGVQATVEELKDFGDELVGRNKDRVLLAQASMGAEGDRDFAMLLIALNDVIDVLAWNMTLMAQNNSLLVHQSIMQAKALQESDSYEG